MLPNFLRRQSYSGVMRSQKRNPRGKMLGPEDYHDRNHVWANGYLPSFEECWECQRQQATCKAKKYYKTFVAANEQALEINVEREWHWQLVRPYRCRYCDGWHLKSARSPGDKKKVEQQRRKWLIAQTERPSERDTTQELERNMK